MRFLQVSARVILALWLVFAPVKARAGSMALLGAGGGSAAPAYVGPGNVVASATMWGSCARVYTTALASTSTQLCDLVDSAAPAVTICTLRGSASGFVDLAGAYCTGSVAPSAKCAAATGGKCFVSKIYDQTGNANHLAQTTGSNQPALTFAGANSLPGVVFTSAAGAVNFIQSANVTIAQPLTLSMVALRNANFTTAQGAVSNGSTSPSIGFANSANTLRMQGAANSIDLAGTDSAYHAAQAIFNGTSGFLSSDGTDSSSGVNVTGSFAAGPIRFGRSPQTDGILMEGGVWPSAFATGSGAGSGQAMTANQRSSTNGYNF